MNVKKFTFSILSLLFAVGLAAQPATFKYDLSGGNFGSTAIPEYENWHYFSFETGEIVGKKKAVINEGAEVIDAEWAARTDWDIAFHATDIRTNNGSAIKIADSKENNRDLEEVFTTLTEAPTDGYAADETLNGMFIFEMKSMPPVYVGKLSACGATNGWAAVAMNGNQSNPTVAVFKTASNKYVKVYLKKFFGDGTEGSPAVGDLEMKYEILSGTSDMPNAEIQIATTFVSDGVLYTNSASENISIEIYNLAGTLIKAANAQSVSVAELGKGVYVVKVSTEEGSKVQKVIVR